MYFTVYTVSKSVFYILSKNVFCSWYSAKSVTDCIFSLRWAVAAPWAVPPRALARISRLGCAPSPLDWRERLRVMRDTARALHYLHWPTASKGIVLHRDVKPTNILLDEQLNSKLADVGLARHMGAGGDTHVSSRNLVGTRRSGWSPKSFMPAADQKKGCGS